jgi:hypothetical protein
MIRSRFLGCSGVVFAAVLTGGPARGASPASDNASNGPYIDGWQTGDNGGFGFAPWALAANGGFVGIGSSTANGDAAAPAGDIDSAGGRAWAMGSKSGMETGPLGQPRAVRPFIGSLSVGQQVSFDLDGYAYVANSDELRVSLANATGARWYMAIFAGGIMVSDGPSSAGQRVSTTPTTEGMHVDFLLTGPDTFTASVRVLDGREPVVVSGALSGAAGSAVDRIAFDVAPSFGPVDAFYLNNLAVTPEPGLGMLCVFGAGVLARRRRRG